MPRTLKTDIPGPDWRLGTDALRDSGWAEVFAPDVEQPLPLFVDLGFGRGEFISEMASRTPERGFVGVEISHRRVLKLARRLARTELRNIRLVETTAELALVELFPESSVQKFWINFPDPWPKKRHARRRLVQPDFVRSLALRLVPLGDLEVATDHVAYAEQVCEVLSGEALLENVYTPSPWLPEVVGRFCTGYEREWREEGRPLHFFRYRRRAQA